MTTKHEELRKLADRLERGSYGDGDPQAEKQAAREIRKLLDELKEKDSRIRGLEQTIRELIFRPGATVVDAVSVSMKDHPNDF